jgi:hypothetical protein
VSGLVHGFPQLVLAMLIGHALADYPLQGDFLSRGKVRNSNFGSWWPWLLGSHALIHGGFVWAITGSMTIGLAEVGAHAAIDFLKCERRIGFHADQTLHVICKLLWAAIATRALA